MITDDTEKGNEEAAKGVRKIIDEELFISYCSSAIEGPKSKLFTGNSAKTRNICKIVLAVECFAP